MYVHYIVVSPLMDMGLIHGFDWDSGNWPKCGRHGVSKEEIESLFSAAPLVFSDDLHSSSEERFKAIGRNQQSRHVYVNFTLRQHDFGKTLIRPISARYMHKEEIESYERS